MLQKILCFSLCAMLTTVVLWAQTNTLIVTEHIKSPRDTTVRKALILAIDQFLLQTDKPARDNTFIRNKDLLETSLLIDEMKDIEMEELLQASHFYKPHLINIASLSDSIFIIQLAYMAMKDSFPKLKATFSLLVTKDNNQFYFSAPLKRNTLAWKSQIVNNSTVYYKQNLNTTNAKIYFDTIASFDKRLNAPALPTDFYCADDFNEVLHLIGVDYKSDYAGYAHASESAKENNRYIAVNGGITANFTTFDPHDLWHDRLHKVLSTDIINRPVDEGTAYLYGGSWGLSWAEILHRFKNFATANPDADWVSLYNESKNFDEKAPFPLNVDFAINALIVQQIEADKGFPAVISLLSCGKKVPGNKNYFDALEKIAGITKTHFNAYVWKLLRK